MPRWTTPTGLGGWLTLLLGVLFAAIGLTLVIGGVRLVALGGSWYYLIAGLALIVSGVLLVFRDIRGAWVYIATFVATVLWALWEVGLDGWGLVPRVVAPLVLLIGVVAAFPVLTSGRGGKKLLGIGFVGIAVFCAVVGVAVAQTGKFKVESPVPQPGSADYSDAAPIKVGTDWPVYGGSESAQRYSPLAQINKDNVGKLERAWVYRTGDMPGKYGPETTLLKIGDTLYGCTAMNKIFALDARNGERRWQYDPQVPESYIPYTAACRGVTHYVQPNVDPAQPCATRIIEGTLDARLIAVDARTGRPCPAFGQNGQVDVKQGLGDVIPSTAAITAAPVIVRGVVVTGYQVLDGQRRWAPSGVIRGYDAVTGELRFAWDMMRPETTTTPPEGQTYTPGTPNMWTTATVDENLGLVFLPMGNSGADYYSSLRRPAEDEYSTSLVALDVTTGKPRWHFQTVHNDVWDYDLGSQVTLVDNYPSANGPVPAVILPSKQGDIYVLDRRTGQPLHGVENRPVPQGGVEPAQRSRTQPFSLFANLRKPDLTERDMWGMSPIDQMFCRIQYRSASYEGFYTPPTTDKHYIQYPGYNGGSDWGSIAIDPTRGVIIANYNDTPNYNRLIPRSEADKMGLFPVGDPRNTGKGGAEGAGPQEGVPYAIDVNAGWLMPTGMLCKEPPYGGIRALDMKTGRTFWDHPFGLATRNGPFGIPSMLPIPIGTPNNGGAVVTAGGLIFVAATTDNLIRAIDIETGKTVWSDTLPAGGQANPMIYEQDGRQYLVIMAGGHHFMKTPEGDYFIAYALPQKG